MAFEAPIDITDEALDARDRLLVKISSDHDLPTLGTSVSRVVQLASSDDEAVRNLAYFVLSDVALTQKILRLANTVHYRTASGASVTTISKAIFLLGFDTVKTSALAMMLVDRMSGKHATSLRAELSQALSASVVGRELARRSHFKDAEEAAVAALFKNIGRVLVAAHDHGLYSEILALTESGARTPAQASLQVLGCSFELLAESVLREWQIPDTIVQALKPLPGGILRPPKTRQEWLQQVAAFSAAAATLIPHMNEPGHDVASRALLTRYGAALNLDADRLTELLAAVADETRILTENAGLVAGPTVSEAELIADSRKASQALDFDVPSSDHGLVPGLPAELFMRSPEPGHLQITHRYPSGKPINARDLLLAGVQDVTDVMASGRCKVNDLVMLVLETIHRSMGFRFSTVCLKDIKTNHFRARVSLGDDSARRQAGFNFSTTPARDLFHLAMENDADLMIADASSTRIHDLIPSWHRALLPDACSFIVLPLVINKKPFGLFYADRNRTAPEGVPADETALIRMLKAQVLTALQTR
ncbi:MAG: HDOD domain-containing protein [Herminiimonas sp.]|nr:HDOD domain-containing protein [Herminiimonas sp.]